MSATSQGEIVHFLLEIPDPCPPSPLCKMGYKPPLLGRPQMYIRTRLWTIPVVNLPRANPMISPAGRTWKAGEQVLSVP